jgi:hypothetical protein
MRIKVEIGDDVQEYIYDRKGIFVGSDSRCQLSLAYEDIAPKHLKIVSKNSKTYIQDLNSGEQTYYNSKQLTPGSIVEFNTFFPIEVGGILIYLLDEVVTEPRYDKPLDSIAGNIDSVEKDPEDLPPPPVKEDDSLPAKNTNSFKRDLFADSSESLPTKEKKNQIPKSATKAGGTRTTKINTKVNSRNRKKRSERQSEKLKSSILKSSNLRGFMIFFFGVCILGGIYYTKFYSLNVGISKVDVDKEKLILLISDEAIGKHKESFTSALTRKHCGDIELKEMCSRFEEEFHFISGKHISLVNKVLYVGVELDSVLEYLNVKDSYLANEVKLIEELVKSDYSTLFDWESFRANNLSSNLPGLVFKRNKYKGILGLIKIILNSTSFDGNKNNYQQINLFLKNSIGLGEVEITNMILVDADIYSFKQSQIDKNKFVFKSITMSNLTENVIDFISSFGETSYSPFSPGEFQAYKKQIAYEGFNSLLQKPKCLSEFESKICSHSRLNKDKSRYEGVIFEDDNVYILSDLLRVESLFSEFSEMVYEAKDKKIISNIFKRMRLPGQTFEDFYKSDFIAKVSQEKFFKNLLLSDFIMASYQKDILENQSVKNVYLIGITTGENDAVLIDAVVGIKRQVLERDWDKNKMELIKYMYKSRLDIFTRLETLEL